MFVDVGRVDGGDPEYLTWQELATIQDSGRWQLQLHSGKGHTQIHYGSGPDDYGPFYAYEQPGEDFDGWRDRVHSDIAWGQTTLADHISAYRPLAFAPPYGSYGQDGTNDPRIPDDLLAWLTQRYDAVFTQDVNARAQAGCRTAARAESRSPAPPPEATCTRCCSPASPDRPKPEPDASSAGALPQPDSDPLTGQTLASSAWRDPVEWACGRRTVTKIRTPSSRRDSTSPHRVPGAPPIRQQTPSRTNFVPNACRRAGSGPRGRTVGA